MNTSSATKQLANHSPTSIESVSAAAIPPSPATITTDRIHCTLCLGIFCQTIIAIAVAVLHHPPQHQARPHVPHIQQRRQTKQQRRQNPRPQRRQHRIQRQPQISGRSGNSLPSTVGNAYSTPSPSTTPISAPATPSNSVCNK